MGTCGSKATSESATNKSIDTELRKENKQEQNCIKLLLLGAGESGKSTIFKQARILHKSGFPPEEKATFVSTVHQNVQSNFRELLTACGNLEIALSPEEQDLAVFISNHFENGERLNPELATRISQLWKGNAFQKAYERRAEFQLFDSAQYFFEDIIRISEVNYLPTEDDILRSRVRTTGITNIEFEMEKVKFAMYDVGGQRNERRKWIHCFDNVHAVIFVAAISEYDQVLYEDNSINRLIEALNLFAEIANSRFFRTTAMLLFLNKMDLFEAKVNRGVPITPAFPDYNGPLTISSVKAFIKNKFEGARSTPEQLTYTHFTCATDTSSMQVVFGVVKDVMFERNMKASGFV